MSSPAMVIAKREFLERVRSKWFAIVTVLGPILMIALIVVPAVLAGRGPGAVKVEIIDRTGKLGDKLVAAFEKAEWKAKLLPATTDEATELARIKSSAINGFITISADALTWDGVDEKAGLVTYQGDNASSTAVLIAISKTVAGTLLVVRGLDAGITPAQLAAIAKAPNIKLIHTTGEAGGSSGMAVFFLGYALMIILYIAILLYGVAVMRSVVQEKTSRVIELMVATAKPRSLMAGKILGVGAVGLLQLSIWLLMGLLTMKYREGLLGMFGVDGSGFNIPPLEIDQVCVALLYFIGGYFFYASMYAAVGAMVSSEQEAQQAQTPVMMLIVIPMLCMQLVANDPRGSTAAIMTLVPFSSPILMPMRYLLGGATLVDVLISAAILFGSTYLVVRAAAKIYRVGILLYGKRPNLKELIRWLRY